MPTAQSHRQQPIAIDASKDRVCDLCNERVAGSRRVAVMSGKEGRIER